MKRISKKEKTLIIVLVIVLIAVNYSFLNNLLVENFSGKEVVFVERVVDGDTVIVNGGSVRLLGINTPERGEKYYSEAKEFLESEVLGRALIIEKHGQDKYYRDLAYLFDFETNKNINLEIVREGYGNYYFYSGKDKYSEDLIDAWNKCIEKEINLCEKSLDKCSDCVKIESENSIINNCCFFCDVNDWEINVEGRNNFVFEGILSSGETKVFDLDLTNSGGSLFLRDEEGKLVFWERKGY